MLNDTMGSGLNVTVLKEETNSPLLLPFLSSAVTTITGWGTVRIACLTWCVSLVDLAISISGALEALVRARMFSV